MSFEKEQYNQIEKTSHLEMIKQLFGNTQIDSLFGFLEVDIKVPNKLEELLVLSITMRRIISCNFLKIKSLYKSWRTYQTD